MEHLYTATMFAGALVCLLASMLLFLRRKSGERARIILAVIVLFSVFNYSTRFIDLCYSRPLRMVLSPELLLLANFMILSYILYPIEVIAPRWLNVKKIFILYSPISVLGIIYILTRVMGVNYASYSSIVEMLNSTVEYGLFFNLLLVVLLVLPLPFVIYLHQTKKYNNTNIEWLKRYSIALSINIIAYLSVLIFNNIILHTIYYYISVGCSLYIVYMELFDRIIVKDRPLEPYKLNLHSHPLSSSRDEALIARLNRYMNDNCAWRDPDISLNSLASALYTNRTTLASVMHDNGFESYSSYINRLRIEDFLKQVQSDRFDNFQDIFFFVGYRSRSAALRNFKQYTGKTPSEYFINRKK